jgi:hypothetical protein
MPGAAVFEAPGRVIVEYALDRSKDMVLVLPAAPGDSPAIAVFRTSRVEATPPEKSARTRPMGILGLSEALELEEDGPPTKRNWWQRLWSD